MPSRRPRRPRRAGSRLGTLPQFKPVHAGELDDLTLLPRRFELHREEVRTSFELLGMRVETIGERLERKLDVLLERVERTERRIDTVDEAASHSADVNGTGGSD